MIVVDDQSSAEVKKWRRRERSMLAGVILWALVVSISATFVPEQTAEWITTRPPFVVTGTILLTVGLVGMIVEILWLVAARWMESSNSELTEVP